MRGSYSTTPGLAPCALSTVPFHCPVGDICVWDKDTALTQSHCQAKRPIYSPHLPFLLWAETHNTTHQPRRISTPRIKTHNIPSSPCPSLLPCNMASSSNSTPAKAGDCGFLALATVCHKGFIRLVDAAEKSSLVGTSSLQGIREQQDRFDEWANDFGVLLPVFSGPPPAHAAFWLGRHGYQNPEKLLSHHLSQLIMYLQLATEIAQGRLAENHHRTWQQIIETAAILAEFDVSLASSGYGSDCEATGATSDIMKMMKGIKGRLKIKFGVKLIKEHVYKIRDESYTHP